MARPDPLEGVGRLVLDLRRLRHAVAVARHGGFTRAATALNASQSSITKSVQALEASLGLRLFERTPGGILTTSEGAEFIRKAAAALGEIAQLEADSKAVRRLETGRLRLAAAPEGLDMALTAILPGLIAQHPGLQVSATSGAVEAVADALAHAEIDVAIGAFAGLEDRNDLDLSLIIEMPVALFVRRGHPLDRAEAPAMAELLAFPMVAPTEAEPHASILRRLAREAGLSRPVPHTTTGSMDLRLRIVEQTDSFSAAFVEAAGTEGFKRRFRCWPDWRPLPTLPIYLATRRGASASPSVACFRRLALAWAADRGGRAKPSPTRAPAGGPVLS